MPLGANLQDRDANIAWGWMQFPDGECFILRLCSIRDPDWKGFYLKKTPLKTLGMGFTKAEAEQLVQEHNDSLKETITP